MKTNKYFIKKKTKELDNVMHYLYGRNFIYDENSKAFFNNACKMEVNEFIDEFNNRYGKLLKCYYEMTAAESLKEQKQAANVFLWLVIISVVIGIILGFVYFFY